MIPEWGVGSPAGNPKGNGENEKVEMIKGEGWLNTGDGGGFGCLRTRSRAELAEAPTLSAAVLNLPHLGEGSRASVNTTDPCDGL